ncbi:M48 family metallopeptidase [Halodesulfurarchaeum formicicum]|uniref:Peptidase M48 n=1 Tax=Halodesulfurarchaeum formicicum TaxID=1873524 RepID=A0A1J1ADT2_9EURY|nr:M48 family metallopeptidase [Halodesulfurarchaeum formicicum]APE95939.1 peptidase M48 [Halodesulfurarchaeum formicicum]
MLAYHAVFLLLVVGSTGVVAGLAALNVRHADRRIRERSAWVTATLSVDDPARLRQYHRLSTSAGTLKNVLVLAIVLLVLYTGLFGDAIATIDGAIGNDLLAGVGIFVVATVTMQLLSLPFEAFDTFGIEAAYGFNEQSPQLFVRDAIVGTAVSVAFVSILGAGILLVLQQFPTWWWLAATGVVALFVLGSQIVVPRVIMPLFYDFEPIEDGDLRTAVEAVFDRAGFTCEDVYAMNASSRSGHSNAFFTGFGRTKRVVLFDTLIEQLEERELQSVLAHELAHWKQNHVWQRMAVSILEAAVLLALAQILLGQSWLYAMFGVPEIPAAGLLLAGLWLEPVLQFTQPLSNRLWLRSERAADDFAVEVMGSGEPLAAALAQMTGENLSNPFPHPLYEAFHYQHPPVPERIRRLVEGADR